METSLFLCSLIDSNKGVPETEWSILLTVELNGEFTC
jgi:hypothetical protein